MFKVIMLNLWLVAIAFGQLSLKGIIQNNVNVVENSRCLVYNFPPLCEVTLEPVIGVCSPFKAAHLYTTQWKAGNFHEKEAFVQEPRIVN